MGVMTLFEADTEDDARVFDEKISIPEIEFDKQQRLALKEMLGRYISDHPLDYEDNKEKCDTTSLGFGIWRRVK